MGPNGRAVLRWLSRPKAIEDMADAVIGAGGQFKIERTPNSQARIICVYNGKTIAYKAAMLATFPMENAVDTVVKKAYGILAKEQPGGS